MSDDSIDPEERAEYLICANCIGEDFLKAKVEQSDEVAECAYCGGTAKTISLGDLVGCIGGYPAVRAR